MTARPIVLGVLGVFLMAGLVPAIVTAEPSERGKDRRSDHPLPEAAKRRLADHAFTINISGTGVDRQNASYRIQIDGDGLAKVRNKDGNVTGFRGKALVVGVISDANGTVLRQGEFRVKIQAHQDDEGEWKWHLESVGKKQKGMPRLNLRGDATQTDGALDLMGHGKAVFKKDGEKRATPLKLDVTGTIARLL